ncbi:MAG: primosomal protein N', partial [bacterium]
FDYLPPSGASTKSLTAGMRVKISFGRRETVGMVMEITDQSDWPVNRLKHVRAVLDEAPLLPAEQLAFLRWAAAYYQHAIGEVVMAAIPVHLRKGKPEVCAVDSHWQLTDAGREVAVDSLTRAPRQAALLALLAKNPSPLSGDAIRTSVEQPAPILKRLQEKGWVEQVEAGAIPAAPVISTAAPTLNSEQQAALEATEQACGQFSPILLEGLTGSGKTEVYLRAAGQVLAKAGSVLVLVPEISLTPQLVSRFRARLGDRISVLHSAMTDRERCLSWQQAVSGEHRVVIGTRSAVFTPVPGLQMIIVDEEHDISFKQQDGFRYSARDLAVVLAQRSNCPVVLGSATPSLESLRNAFEGRYQHLQIKRRAGGASSPDVRLIDCSNIPLKAGLSAELLVQMKAVLDAGQQALVFLNRRGFAPVLTCFSCGWISECPRCDARQTLHAHSHTLWCHHCGSQRPEPRRCPDCGEADVHPLGQGTEQLEQVLQQQFPGFSLVRIDRDSTRRKGSLEQKLHDAKEGRASILLGTQMLAKGHDFPGVTLVAIVDVDAGLFGADFRAAERMAQLIVQVAGRAGRGELPGQVLIQSRHPDHPLLQTLVNQGYDAFARQALTERQEANLPPHAFQALLRAESTGEELAATFLSDVAALVAGSPDNGVECWGPVPAPMYRRAGKHREQLLLQANQRAQLQRLLGWLVPQAAELESAKKVRYSFDVDPQDLY